MANGGTTEPRRRTPLLKVGDPRIRNIVRGVLAARDDEAARKTMESLRRECSLEDALTAFRFLQDDPLAQHLPKPSNFPTNLNDLDRVPIYASARWEIELAGQLVRVQLEAERLCKAIKLVGLLNQSILSSDAELSAALFLEYRERFGLSLMVAGKAIGLRHSMGPGAEKRQEYSDVITPFFSPRRQVVAAALEDSLDIDRAYLRVRRTFLRFAEENRLNKGDAAVISDLFSPVETSELDAGQRLQAYGRWSALDTVAFLFRLRQMRTMSGRAHDAAIIDAAIPANVREAWSSTFDALDVKRLAGVLVRDDQFAEQMMFAHAPTWSEYPTIYDYRIRVEVGVGDRLNGRFPIIQRTAASFAPPQKSVTDLLSRGSGELDLQSTAPSLCRAFHRTIALIASIENDTLSSFDGAELCHLLDQTVDLPSLLSRDELVKFLPRRVNDQLYELMRTTLLKDAEDNKVSNHALRRALQLLVSTKFSGDIVKLLESVDTENGHVSTYLYYLFTESFLTELYDLYEKADQVTEAQASILEWRGGRQNDEGAILRARSHRLILRLRKVRGAIEETRIYVDPLRFTQWIQETAGGDLRALSTQAEEIIADTDRSISLRDPVKIALQPRLRLLKLLDKCYEEFCTNKIYGVTSFIGRRIRHGTLHGHLVLEFRPEVQAAVDEFEYSAPRFSEFLKDWITRFDAAVSEMAADMIHVRSKDKPKGLIVATLDDAEKVSRANTVLGQIAKSMIGRSQQIPTLSLIQDSCWFLFEVDLTRTRDAVESLRRQFAIQVEQHRYPDGTIDRRVSDRIRALNSALHQRFEIVRSWFTRPTNLSPSASIALLFEAVLDEVRQRYPGFDSEPIVQGEVDIDLLGHRFHFFYDALYILVDNAAKHGNRSGVLTFNVNSNLSDEKYMNLSIDIASEFKSDACEEAKLRIEEAMSAEIGDAMVNHGRSGIRKLRGLVENVEEIVGFSHVYVDDGVVFTIEMRYPR